MVRSPPKFCSCGLYNFIFTLFKIKTKQYLKCLLVHFKIIKHPLFFNWRIIALQCCIGFCHTITPISHNYIYIYIHIYIYTHIHIYIYLHTSLPTYPQSHPLGQHRALGWAPDVIHQLPTSYLFYKWECIFLCMVVYIRQCYFLNSSHLLLPLLCPHICPQ